MESPSSLADRYVAVWNETDPERRTSQIAELWVTRGRHYVGDREVEGYEALKRRVREVLMRRTSGIMPTDFGPLTMLAGCTTLWSFTGKCFPPAATPFWPAGLNFSSWMAAERSWPTISSFPLEADGSSCGRPSSIQRVPPSEHRGNQRASHLCHQIQCRARATREFSATARDGPRCDEEMSRPFTKPSCIAMRPLSIASCSTRRGRAMKRS